VIAWRNAAGGEIAVSCGSAGISQRFHVWYNRIALRIFGEERSMSSVAANLRVNGLGPQKMSRLTSKAKRLGMTPERYVRELVEEDLALDEKAESTSLREIMGPGREVDEVELDRLVDAARKAHHRRITRKRRS
jgi:hypothetical protein